MFTRRIEPGDWLDGCYEELARRSVDAGVSIQTTREAAVLCDQLQRALGNRSAEVIPFPVAVRAVMPEDRARG